MSKKDKSFKAKYKTNTKLKSKSKLKLKCKSRTRKNFNKNKTNGLMDGGGWSLKNIFKSKPHKTKITHEVKTLVKQNPKGFSQANALKHFGSKAEVQQNLYTVENPVKQKPGENPYQYLSKPGNGNTYMDVSLEKSKDNQNLYSILNRSRSKGPRNFNTPTQTKEAIDFAKYAANFNAQNSRIQTQKLNRFNTTVGNTRYKAQQKQRQLELENRKSSGQPSKYTKSANNVAKQIEQAKLNAAKFEQSEKNRAHSESIITAKSGNYNVASPSKTTKPIERLSNTEYQRQRAVAAQLENPYGEQN
jgi:hypothetical protein